MSNKPTHLFLYSLDVAEEAEHAEDRDGVLLEAVGCRRYAVVSSLHHQGDLSIEIIIEISYSR